MSEIKEFRFNGKDFNTIFNVDVEDNYISVDDVNIFLNKKCLNCGYPVISIWYKQIDRYSWNSFCYYCLNIKCIHHTAEESNNNCIPDWIVD